MTKRESAEKIVRQKGICAGIMCQDCIFLEDKRCGESPEHYRERALQWLKDSEIPELKPILCEVWDGIGQDRQSDKIIGKLNGRYLSIDGDRWDNAKPIKEKTKRPMTREEKEKYLKDNIGKVLDIFDFPEVEE